jgi:hypothetical protein
MCGARFEFDKQYFQIELLTHVTRRPEGLEEKQARITGTFGTSSEGDILALQKRDISVLG